MKQIVRKSYFLKLPRESEKYFFFFFTKTPKAFFDSKNMGIRWLLTGNSPSKIQILAETLTSTQLVQTNHDFAILLLGVGFVFTTCVFHDKEENLFLIAWEKGKTSNHWWARRFLERAFVKLHLLEPKEGERKKGIFLFFFKNAAKETSWLNMKTV